MHKLAGGAKSAFNLYRYHTLLKSKAVHGASICKMAPLIAALLKGCPQGEVSYKVLREVVSKTLPYVSQWSHRAGDRVSGYVFGRILFSKASKTGSMASGREDRLDVFQIRTWPKSNPEPGFPARRLYCTSSLPPGPGGEGPDCNFPQDTMGAGRCRPGSC